MTYRIDVAVTFTGFVVIEAENEAAARNEVKNELWGWEQLEPGWAWTLLAPGDPEDSSWAAHHSDVEIAAATQRLKDWRKQHWKERFAGIPEVDRGPVKNRKRPEPFMNHVPVKREHPYVERERCR